MKKVYLFALSFILLLSACSSKKADIMEEAKIDIIKAPQWVKRSQSEYNKFSSVGLTNKKGLIKDVVKSAESNALANLYPAIVLKINDFIDEELIDKNNDKKEEYKKRFKVAIDNMMKKMPVSQLSRRDAMWISPDSDITYAMMVIDTQFVIKYFINEINDLEKTYAYDEEFINRFLEIKKDVENNFTAKQREPYRSNEVQNAMISNTQNSQKQDVVMTEQQQDGSIQSADKLNDVIMLKLVENKVEPQKQ